MKPYGIITKFLTIALMLLAALVAPQTLYAVCVTPPSGMVAWWSLDETSGPTAHDIAGSANNSGTWMNSPTPVLGKVAGALSFSGSNSVDVPDQAELNFGTGDFSIDLWIKTTNASGTRTILDKRTGSVPNLTGYVLFLVNGYLGSQIGDGAGYNNYVSTTGFVANGNWHHVAVTVDRNNTSGWRHYVDGSVVGTPANPTGYQGSLTNTAPFVMARELINPSHTFAGTLDEVELFNRVLDSSEVRSIWAADSLGKCKPGSIWGVKVTPLGNAILTVVDTTLVVGNIGSSGFDGADWHDSKDKLDNIEDIIWLANPDPSGDLPVGASVEAEFFFAIAGNPDSFSMSLSMTKAAINTWDLAIQSDATIYTIKAFDDSLPLPVFSVVDTGTSSLGYIVRAAKGINPTTTFCGHPRPNSVIASSDYGFTPDSVRWTWPAHGVSNLQINYLSISTEVLDTSLVGVSHATMCGDNGAKTDPISFTILNIEVTPHFMRGDVTGDSLIDVGDVVYLINYLFKGGLAPNPKLAGDATCDGVVDVGDVVYLINYLFRGGQPPSC